MRRTMSRSRHRPRMLVTSARAYVAALLDTLTATGYGVWTTTGAGLALDLDLDGRGGVLVPLLLGLVFIALGQVSAALIDIGPRRWRRVVPARREPMPRHEALLALTSFVVMLAVAGLVRGSNDFWATRLFGASLALVSLTTLLAAPSSPLGTAPPVRSRPGGVLSSVFAGGLWLWVIMTLQTPPGAGTHHGSIHALVFVLLVVGLAAGLATQTPLSIGAGPQRLYQMTAVTLAFAVPCLLLVIASTGLQRTGLALAATFSCQIGLCVNERLQMPRTGLRSP